MSGTGVPGRGRAAAVAAAEADLAAPRAEFLFRLPARAEAPLFALLADERDQPLLLCILNIVLTVMPVAVALYCLPASHLLGAAYMLTTYVVFGARFILAFHYSAHRRLFSKEYNFLNNFNEWILSPLFGIPCGTYSIHHCVMHHREDNGELDLSSTEGYQRDNFFHFLHYWMRFTFLAVVELPHYCVKRRRWDLLARLAIGEPLYYLLLSTLSKSFPVQTLWTLTIPYFFSSFLLMFGNWSQHIFVDPSKPESDYTLTYNCVQHADNQKTFNDGYHIIHHVNSRLHWSEMPRKFIESIEKHAEEEALVFKGIGFFEIGVACMIGKLGWLADHVLSCHPEASSKDEVVALLKERLRPAKRLPKKDQ